MVSTTPADLRSHTDWTSRLYLVRFPSALPPTYEPKAVIALWKVRYDVRGYGTSGKLDIDEDWGSERFVQDFRTIVEAFKLRRPFVAGCRVVDHRSS